MPVQTTLFLSKRLTALTQKKIFNRHRITLSSSLFEIPKMETGKQNCIVIGVGGVTNGGKTTLCKALQKRLSAEVFHMDHYFWPADSPNHVRLPEFSGHANWDCVHAVDFKKLHTDVLDWMKKHSHPEERALVESSEVPVLIVEGILILNYKPLSDLFHRKYFLHLTKEQCVGRRNLRVYEPADPEGYFDEIVWPMYLESKAMIENEPSIEFILGTDDKNMTFERVLNDIKSHK